MSWAIDWKHCGDPDLLLNFNYYNTPWKLFEKHIHFNLKLFIPLDLCNDRRNETSKSDKKTNIIIKTLILSFAFSV